MRSKTHIIILHMKEIIYTVVFSLLAVIFIVLLIFMFGRRHDSETMAKTTAFSPGIYSSTLVLGDKQAEISVTVNETGITDVILIPEDDSFNQMYPLLNTCMEDIAGQLEQGTLLNQITYTDSNQYTMNLLIEAINNALQQAAP